MNVCGIGGSVHARVRAGSYVLRSVYAGNCLHATHSERAAHNHTLSHAQSKIRDMKNRLAAFSEVLARQEAAFNELRVVARCVTVCVCV